MQATKQLIPLFYDKEKLIKTPQILYRTNVGDKRYYYTIKETGEVVKFASVTTVLDSTMPTSEYLIKWIAEYGIKRAEDIKNQKAEYGNLLHICFSQFMIKGTFDLASIPSRIETYRLANNIDFNTDHWEWELEKDLRAWEVFCAVHDVKPIAISLMLSSEKLGIAGELDIVLEMRVGTGVNGGILKNDIVVDKNGEIKKDLTRRIIVILDWKSGRHGFYLIHEAQLHLYKLLWNETFPHLQIDGLYNWSPKNWETEPAYNLKEQSESREGAKVKHYIDLFRLSGFNEQAIYYPKKEGRLQLGKRNGNFRLETFEETILRLHKVQPASEESNEADNFIAKTVSDAETMFPEKAVIEETTELINSINTLLQPTQG